MTDPYGWAGPFLDPWLLDPAGAASTRLWLTELAPRYRYSDPSGWRPAEALDAPAPATRPTSPD